MMNAHAMLYLITIFITSTTNKKLHIASRTDFSKCKLTNLGTEYMGSTMTTAGGIRCQLWKSEQPLHKVSPDITDIDFPERSMRLAKNYCRNPTRDSRGPWCYTMERTLIDDECDVPLCNYGECRISGTGAEYGGGHKTGSSGKKCKSWDKHHRLADGKTIKYPKNRFSDLSREKAKNFCRNPDDDLGGPWCYTEDENYEIVKKEYCDVPFCDDKDCLVYVRNASVYSTITNLNSTLGNITFWIKLWNPLDEQKAEIRLLLGLLPIPTTSKKIAQEWWSGVEIVISNSGSGQLYPNTDNEPDFESTPNIILGSKWTGLWITWGGGFMSVGLYDTSKPLFMGEYKKKKTISQMYPESFFYYGIVGTGVLWSTDFCQDSCELHTTFGMEFLRVWPLVMSNSTFDLKFYVRAAHGIAIRLYQSPGAPFPCFTMLIGHDNVTMLIYQENEKSAKQYLKDVPSKKVLDFWTWNEFTISIFGTDLRLFLQRLHGNEELLYAKHHLLNTLRWYSTGSQDTIAHWTFYCSPEESDAVEKPWPPNCITNPTDYTYKGSQWTAADNTPCIPWTANEIPKEEKKDNLFVDGSAVKALNKCRNPTHDSAGPYCYSISTDQTITKQYCQIRNCRSSECRMAGTANDYIGTLSTTRSGRTCAKWMSDYDLKKLKEANETTTQKNDKKPRENLVQPVTSNISKPVHAVNPVYFNDSLYPERNVIIANNYCRDPSRNIAGTWCYTTDPLVPQDLCNVRDCEKPEECIFFVRGHGIGRHLYVLPEHRSEGIRFSLKEWEPDRPDSITFVFKADNGLKSRYILKVGAIKNEKVLLYVQSEDEAIKLVKTKTLPHLLYLGKWSSFVIRIPRGRVQVFYEGATKPLFEWKHPEPSKAFLPIYYYYTSELGNTIGVSFDCHTRCHIETTETDRFTRILPLSMWRTEETPSPDKLILMIRGKGVILIPLLLLPATSGYYGLTIGEFGQWIFFLRNTYPLVHIFHKQKAPGPLFTTDSWTNLTIRWHNNTIEVLRNETVVFHYEHPSPLLFYFFSLAVDTGGWATWAANCIPSDIDGDAEDGGWSEWGPWACSASCNGGMGTRKRLCNSPEPNVRGEPCLGPSIMTGRCNTNICGDITDDTLALITRSIQKNHTTLQVKEGHAITISVDLDIIDSIKADLLDVDLHWSRNGIFIEEEEGRIEIENFDILIIKATLNDSGIYTMTLHRVDGSHLIVKIISLAVYPVNSIVSIRETLPFFVTCHCVTLGYVFSDLKIYWTIGKRVWKDYGTTLPIAVNVDYVDALNRSHQGTWRCVVEQSDLQFKWITNIIILKVLGAPNWRTHLMEDTLTRPIFGWMPNESFVAVSAIIIFLALSMCIVGATVVFIKFQDSLKFKEPTIDGNVESGKSSFMTKLKKRLKTSSLRTSGRVSESNENTETDDLLRGRNKGSKEKDRMDTEEYTEDTSPSDSEGVPKESLETKNFLDRWKLKKREKKVPRKKEVTDESEGEKLLNTNNTDEYQSDQPTTN